MSPNTGRKPGVPDSLIIQRIKYSIELKHMGLSMASVLKRINAEADSKGWGQISFRQLRRDFNKYYQATSVIGFEEKEQNRAMREIFLQEMEALIEKESERIRLKKDWEPFEYEKAMKLLFDMKMKYADLKNWNESKQKEYTLKMDSLRPTEHEKYERASDEFMIMDPVIKEELLIKPLKELAEQWGVIENDETLDDETRAERIQELKKAVMDRFNPEADEDPF